MMGNHLLNKMTWKEFVERTRLKTNITDDGFTEWMESKEKLGTNFDYFLWRACWNIIKRIRNNGDFFIVCSGMEGSGKSTLAIKIGSVISENFNINSICFSIHDFITRIDDAKRGDVFILDEGAMFQYGRESLKQDNVMMAKLFQLLRQKNLCIIICIPKFFDIDKYIRDHRVDLLLHIPKKEWYKYTAYTKKAIDKMNFERSIHIRAPHGSFWQGYWTKSFPEVNDLTNNDYITAKANHLGSFIKNLKQIYKPGVGREFYNTREVKQKLNISDNNLARMIKKKIIKAVKIGKHWRIPIKELERIKKKGTG